MHRNHNMDQGFKKFDGATSLKRDAKNDSNSSANFDCNICLEVVQEPVVTFCGHLYCWPCIYKWISKSPKCPICKKEVSEDSLIPLYGRGQTNAMQCPSSLDSFIPQRPTNPNDRYSSSSRVRSYDRSSSSSSSHDDDDSVRYCMFDPMIGMLGEMVFCSRMMFGNNNTRTPLYYAYRRPNSYDSVDRGSPRQARRIAEADESLGRVFFFLCSCVFMCLILF